MSQSNLPWANKELGQHFLQDQNIIDAICSDKVTVASEIIEVGPGPGILTKHLAETDLPFKVIEKDLRFVEYLNEFISGDQIKLCDALKLDFNNECQTDGGWLVSNLPYNISVPLLIKFINAPNIKYMTLMFQKEVGEKAIYQKNEKKNKMGSLMTLCETFFDSSLLCNVPPEAFIPPPKVNSVVVSFTRKKDPQIPLSEFKPFEKFLRQLFALKRKQLGTVLKPHFEKEILEKSLDKLEIARTVRAETLTLEHVHGLYRKLCGNI